VVVAGVGLLPRQQGPPHQSASAYAAQGQQEYNLYANKEVNQSILNVTQLLRG